MIEPLSKIIEPRGVTAWSEDAAISRERWQALTARLIDAMSGEGALSYAAIQRETNIERDWLDIFCASPETLSGIRRSLWGATEMDKTNLEKRADSLEACLVEFELKRRARGAVRTVETGITRDFYDFARQCRDACQFGLFDRPSGIGKTRAAEDYLRKVRLSEGVRAPVWLITLDEYCLSHKSILSMIGGQVVRRDWDNRDPWTMSKSIREATDGAGGLLIVDEGQHLADANLKQGESILNGLRSFVDAVCFGVVLIGNGEVYRKYYGRVDRTQLFSRLEPAIATDENMFKDEDVDAIARAWEVQGVKAMVLSREIAKKPGALRRLVRIYTKARRDFGVIDYDTMMASGAKL